MNRDHFPPSWSHAGSASPADLAFLADAGTALARSLDPSEVAAAIVGAAVPYLGEWGVVEYREEEGDVCYAVAGAIGREEILRALNASGIPGGAIAAMARRLGAHRSGVPLPLVSSELRALLGDGEDTAGLPRGSAMVLPLGTEGSAPLGHLLLGDNSASGERSSAGTELAGRFAEQAGLALANALRFQQARTQAENASEELRNHRREAQDQYDSLLASMRKIEVRVRRLFEANVIGIIFSSINGTLVEANDAFLQMVGYTREDLRAGRIRWDLMTPPEHMAASMNAVDELVRLGVCTPFEKEYYRKDGTRVPVLLGSALLEGTNEQTVGFVLDLSERKRAEKALLESEERNRALLAAIPDLIFRIDHHGRLLDLVANDTSGLNLPKEHRLEETMLGRSIAGLFPADIAAAMLQAAARALETGRMQRYEYQLPAEGGDNHYEGRLVAGGEGEVLGILRDITDRKKIEEEILKSERRFRAVTDNSWDCIWLLSADGAILYASPSTRDAFGYEPEEVIGRKYAEFLHPEDSSVTDDLFNRLLSAEGTRFTAQFRTLHKDGTRRWIEGGGTNMLGDPALKAIIANFRDISQRKRTELELKTRASQQEAISRFGQQALAGMEISELLDEGVRVVSRIMDVEFCKVLELLPDRNLLLVKNGIGWNDGVVGIRTVKVERNSQAGYTLLASEPVVVVDLKTETRFKGTPLLHEHGITSGISVIIHGTSSPYGILGAHSARRRHFSRDDVHFMQAIANVIGEALARKEAEEALYASEQHYRSLIENSYDATALIDAGGIIRYASPSTTRVLGYTVDELLGRSARELFHSEDLEGYENIFREVISQPGTSVTAHYRNLHKDGSWRWIEGTCTNFTSDSGERAIIANYHDITERRESEIALKEAKEAAEAASRAKDQFLAVLSHELRTPLTPVLASVQALELEPALPPGILPYIDLIRRNVELEARLIDDLLDLTRIAKGKFRLNNEVVDLHALFQHVRDICLGDIRQKSLRLVTDLGATESRVFGDPARLQQVLWNLLQNAVKFTPQGGRISVSTANPVSGRLRLEVSDTGIGIEPHLIRRIFDAFEQGEQTITRRFGGLGLGLAISRMLVTAHGGSLTAASAGRDQGATFTMELAIASQQGGAEESGAIPAPAPEAASCHILLVDDHADTSMVMKILLERQGYRVSTAGSVAGALALAASESFDLLVSDIGLPDGTGLDIMRELRARDGIRGIALSGFGMEDDIRKSRDAGFAEHLTKPVSVQTLVQAIRAILG